MQLSQSSAPHRAGVILPVIFIATIFLSASLLFFVQPLFTKIVLPQIGGSPAIWTTAMLFFQTVLIGGYLYAHLLTRHVPVNIQLIVHLAVWALALFFLPLAVPGGWQFDPDGPIAWQTLMLFGVGVGLPFFALSANAPLIQFWYGRSGGPSASDPYFLYGASNLGSLVALLGFPLVAEPLFGASKIGFGWAVGFAALGAFLLMSGLSARGSAALQEKTQAPTSKLTFEQVFTWAFLAFIPSSLMLSVTSKISLDVGAIPLVWVIPLALYLLTFVMTFNNRRLLGETVFKWSTRLALASLMLIFAGFTGVSLSWFSVGNLIIGFFIVALYAHHRLYQARPDATHLTAFYLTMSIGGALGGLFNSIVGPVLFSGLYEGGTTVILAFLMLMNLRQGGISIPQALVRGAVIGGFAALVAYFAAKNLGLSEFSTVLTCLFATGITAAAYLRNNTASYYAAMLVLVLAGTMMVPQKSLLRDRSFFGSHKVYEAGTLRLYGNGNTTHGAQRIADDTAERPEPLYYYHRNSPMAQVLTSERGMRAQSVGIVGLGVGSLACYKQPGQDWQFYEIDRMVDDIARNPKFFRFMSACAGDSPTHLGDARVVLAGQKDTKYDVLVIDAYSSDSVPVHLTTLEAIKLYMDRLAPDGVLVFHISNRYYDIDRPLARSAEALGLQARMQRYYGNSEVDPGDTASIVVTLSRSTEALGDLANDPRWKEITGDGEKVWTDDYANLLSILK
ncbi:Spermidine synthase [Roseovarius litorisediminis]|uniref:Spermidine synthase n=1 Tax=Roseovarius litorisediminis TaxID=1312363 RepID=A0A1Y5TR72_9RHOB|nr:fused MFS/spermidine synthase [Roseovarius litorisediminis]SLN69985.1 Spermidine synthase [Roseovarius litorisediminis]